MSDNLSLFHILNNASWLVASIIFILIALSCFSWAIIIKKYIFFLDIKRSVLSFENSFWSGVEFVKLHDELQDFEQLRSGLEYIFNAGFGEFRRHGELNDIKAEKLPFSIKQAINLSLANEQQKLEESLPMLASIGSITPYIGLLGTVLGIMSSFFSMSAIQQPSISIIAPGIAEALVTTALGLAVAIPSIFFYNRLVVVADNLISHYEEFSEEFYGILYKKIIVHK